METGFPSIAVWHAQPRYIRNAVGTAHCPSASGPGLPLRQKAHPGCRFGVGPRLCAGMFFPMAAGLTNPVLLKGGLGGLSESCPLTLFVSKVTSGMAGGRQDH